MTNRIAIVAGADSGLGQATALRLHADGLTVVAVDRNEAGLNAVTETGTDWMLSPVRRAVTTMSPAVEASDAGAGAVAGEADVAAPV